MRQLHQKLHLQPHRHTGRVLHHKHTSYRGLTVVFVSAGIAMAGISWAGKVAADSLYVYARIAAPIPTEPAIITEPPDKTVTTNAAVTFGGSCPVVSPKVIIVTVNNGSETGSSTCDDNNNFHASVTLTKGKNVLIARSYTITGDAGPDSAPITIFYNPPTPPPPAPENTNGTGAPGSAPGGPHTNLPLVLTVDKPFIIFGPAKAAVWLGSITGGTAPYTVHLGWGDGTGETHQLARPGQQSFPHRYRLMQPYDITVQVRDGAGQTVTRHYAAVTPYVPPAAGLFATPGRPFWSGTGIWGVYGAYLLVLAGFGWLWVRAHPFAYAAVPAHRRHTPSQAAPRRR